MADLEKRITAKMVLDDTGYNSSINGINSSLKQTQSEFKLASEGLKTFGATSNNLKSAQDALAKQFELQSQKVDTYRTAMEKASQKMNDNIKERDKLKASLDSANTKYQQSIAMYGKESTEAQKAKQAVDQLTTEYNKKGKAVEANAKQIQNYQTNMNKANTEMIKTQGELKKINTELTDNGNKWTKAGDAIKKASSGISGIGDKFKSAGEGIAKSGAVIAVTFGAIGAGSLKAYEEVKTGTNQIARLTGATGKQFEDLKKVYEDTARDSAASFEDIGIAVGTVSQRLDLTGDSLKQASLDFMKFAKVNNVDVTQSVSLVSRAMGDAGIKTDEYKQLLDLLTTASQHSGIQISVLTDNLAKYGAPMRALGFDTKQTIALFSGWEKAGVNTELAFGGMKKAISNWGKAGKDSSVEFKKVLKDIADTPTLAEATTKAIGIFGQKAGPDLADAIKGGRFAYEDFLNILDKSDGTLDATAKNMGGYTAEMKKAWHSVTLATAELGESIAKELAPIMKDVAGTIKDFTKRWDNLSDSTKQSIAKFGLATIAIGGITATLGTAMMGIGGFIKGIGGIVGIGGKLVGMLGTTAVATEEVATAGALAGGVGGATGLGALATGLGGAVIAAAPYIAIAGAVALAGYGIYKGLTQEVVPSVDLFADKVQYTSTTVANSYGQMTTTLQGETIKISDSTKQAVKSYMDMDTGAKGYLQDLYINGQTITGQIVTDSKTKFDNMKNSIVQGYETQKTASLAKLQELFTQQNNITSTEQAEILKKTTDFYTSKQTQTQTYEDQINQIIKTASDNKKTLTSEEVTTISDLQNKMRENAVNSLSQNEVEAQVILQRMKDYDGRITAEQASEHIKKLNESRDGAVQAAEDEYNKSIATVTKMRDEAGSITADQAEKMIESAKKQRDDTVQAAQDTRTNAVEKIKGMNKDIGDNVDTTTGKILTLWDKLKNWWNSWQPQSKEVEVHMPYDTNTNKSTMNNGTIWGTQENWTGNESFGGGYTTLHERGYELYDLPQKTRIFNHEASEDLVLKTAESVATKVAKNIAQNSNGGSSQPIYITVPVNLDGQEIARVSAPYMSEELAFNVSRGR